MLHRGIPIESKSQKIVISEGITYIGNRAFISKSCEKIYFPSTLTGIGSNSLVLEKITAIEIPQSLTDITNLSWSLMPWLECISVADGNTVFSAVDGVLFAGNAGAISLRLKAILL
mgnify:CR=1 FL=1